MSELGTFLLWITYGITCIALLLILFHKRFVSVGHSGVITGLLASTGVLTSSVLLSLSLITGIFTIEYVYHNTESSLPLIYKISAFWSGSAGSMLLWTTFFAVLLFICYFRYRREQATKTIFGVLLVFILIFLSMLVFINNPFNKVSPATDGFGLSPALQSLGMVFHPPVILAGFACFFLSLAYSFYDLRNAAANHCSRIRNWALLGWILLTAGIISGGLWAYTELGWGGYWAWDPIENSSLVNWLLATIFLHGLGGGADRYNQQKKRNFIWIALTVFSTLIGTFIARSGILRSVHAYSNQSVFIFFGLILIGLAALSIFLYIRYTLSGSMQHPHAPVNRLKNLRQPANVMTIVLGFMAVAVFGGTVSPLLGVQTPTAFYDYTFVILGLLLLLLLGFCPPLGAQKPLQLLPGLGTGLVVLIGLIIKTRLGLLTIIAFAVCAMLMSHLVLTSVLQYKSLFTNRGRVASLILHSALLLMALGITFSKGITEEKEMPLTLEQSIRLPSYTVTYRRLEWQSEEQKTIARAHLDILSRKGRESIETDLTYYKKRDINHARAYIKASLTEDLYIIFEGLDESENALFKVMAVKGINLFWLGGILLILGTVLRFKKGKNSV